MSDITPELIKHMSKLGYVVLFIIAIIIITLIITSFVQRCCDCDSLKSLIKKQYIDIDEDIHSLKTQYYSNGNKITDLQRRVHNMEERYKYSMSAESRASDHYAQNISSLNADVKKIRDELDKMNMCSKCYNRMKDNSEKTEI